MVDFSVIKFIKLLFFLICEELMELIDKGEKVIYFKLEVIRICIKVGWMFDKILEVYELEEMWLVKWVLIID